MPEIYVLKDVKTQKPMLAGDCVRLDPTDGVQIVDFSKDGNCYTTNSETIFFKVAEPYRFEKLKPYLEKVGGKPSVNDVGRTVSNSKEHVEIKFPNKHTLWFDLRLKEGSSSIVLDPRIKSEMEFASNGISTLLWIIIAVSVSAVSFTAGRYYRKRSSR